LVGAEGLKDGIGDAALDHADWLAAVVAVTSVPPKLGDRGRTWVALQMDY
jgi:hypothetical protein